jgi:hypothetical protein
MSLQEWYDTTNMASVFIQALGAGLISHRIWRMIARDSIFERPREALFPEGTWRFDLIDCPWCLGWWLNVAIAAVAYVFADASLPTALIIAFAGSTVTGVIGRGD